MVYERVLINGAWYLVDVESLVIHADNPKYVYGMFDAWDETLNEQVTLQYVSINRSKPDPEHPYKIIRQEAEE